MYTIRPLAQDEHSAWLELVAGSPQAGLFQTLEWNQALCETGSQPASILPIVCEHKGSLLGGLILRRLDPGCGAGSNLPCFGYNGPALAGSLEYSARYHTIPAHHVLKDLLVHVRELTECVVIHNQPEVWDVRAFKHLDWKLETSYTHILHHETRPGPCADPELLERMAVELERATVVLDVTENQVRDFCLRAQKSLACVGFLYHRVRVLLAAGMARLVAIHDQDGRELSLSLLLLSRENRTSYLLKTLHRAETNFSVALPTLLWRASQRLMDGVQRLDLGTQAHPRHSRLLDRLGCELLPRFSARS